MPITQSAKKALRQNLRRRLRNRAVKNRLAEEIKRFKRLAAKDQGEARKQLPLIYKLLDKAAKKRVISRNEARRRKSTLSLLVGKPK